jgi:Putative  PD-(D/E)XK family member, (DUF4420)
LTATGRHVLAGTWHALESAVPAPLASIALEPFSRVGVRVARDVEGSRHLLVPTALQARPWSQLDSPLRDAVSLLVFGGRSAKYLDIRCADSNLFDVFDELIIDVLETVDESSDPGAVVESSLERWRAMFRAVASSGFGRERRFGLFAELLVLEASTAKLGIKAIECWTGPSNRPHDFEFPGGCIEVKALGSLSRSVTFHGLRQLEPDRDLPLRILVYSLVESPEGRTIRDLVETIELTTGTGSLGPGLRTLGYTTTSPDDRLAVVDAFVVTVGPDVPALTTTTVSVAARDGIGRVDYDVTTGRLRDLADDLTPSAAIAEAAT